MTVHQCKMHLLKRYWESSSELQLNGNELEESTVDLVAKVTEGGSKLRALRLNRVDRLSDPFIRNLRRIVAHSELRELSLDLKEDEKRVHILESVQWIHLRELLITLGRASGTSVMKTIVGSVKDMPGKVDLEVFWFRCDQEPDMDIPLSIPLGDLLQDFMALTTLEVLGLEVIMNLEHILSLFKMTDFSRLKTLFLWTEGFDSDKVDVVLEGLQHATQLEEVRLLRANITDEQKHRMKTNGVTLRND
jgi:hypothetical protein